MTYMVYMDEQEGIINEEAFTAIIGFRISADDIVKVRARFYPLYNDILDKAIRGKDRNGDRYIHRMPNLHGSDLLRMYDDDVKFEVLDALVQSLEGIDFDFLRLGYFNRSFPKEIFMQDRKSKLDIAMMGVSFAIWDKPHDDHILVSEFDKEALRKSLDGVYSNLSREFALGHKEFSFNLMHFVGYYHATKSELGCQISDVINYCCLKSSNRKDYFSNRLADYYEGLADRYLINQIIWLNDDNKTLYFTQKPPSEPHAGEKNTGPVRRAVKITPNDDFLDVNIIPPVE